MFNRFSLIFNTFVLSVLSGPIFLYGFGISVDQNYPVYGSHPPTLASGCETFIGARWQGFAPTQWSTLR